MKTEFFVDYELYDTTALSDASESTKSNMDFADISLIKQDVETARYVTLEHNFFVLDGTSEEMPDIPDDLAFFSASQSGEDGTFEENPVLRIDFTENHTSIGLTLCFSDVWPIEIEIRWYDLSRVLISKKKFCPDSSVYFARNQIENYGALEIEFIRTLPYHNAKLNHIKYGTTYNWGSDTIKTGKLVNDTDPISDKIKTDKLTFDFIDLNDEFNLGNIDGLHKMLQKSQRMHPYEIVKGTKISLGTFFLDVNTTTKSISKISAIDYKGMLAKIDFKEGRIYAGDLAGGVIDEIMTVAGITDYEVDEETANTPIFGALKIQSCQKALREVLFACNSEINTSRQSGISIRKRSRKVTAVITRDRKFTTTLKTDTYVSDVTVKFNTWTLEENASEITKGTYTTGRHTIQLSNPAANMSVSAGKIIRQMPYYVVLEVSEESEIIITGQKYVSEALSVTASIEHIPPGEVRNTKSFTGTLMDFKSAKSVAENILDYYQLQQIVQTKHIGEAEKAGDWAEIENPVVNHGNFVACIESLTTDLTGGFISTAKYRGYYKLLIELYYCGSELYADEEVGII